MCFFSSNFYLYLTFSYFDLVETWPNGRGRMNSSCRAPYVVENIAELDFPHISNEDFTTRHDHAKWAISLGRLLHDYDRFDFKLDKLTDTVRNNTKSGSNRLYKEKHFSRKFKCSIR